MANLQSLQLKVNQLAKDFGLKGKDISDALAANGIEVKTTQYPDPRAVRYAPGNTLKVSSDNAY